MEANGDFDAEAAKVYEKIFKSQEAAIGAGSSFLTQKQNPESVMVAPVDDVASLKVSAVSTATIANQMFNASLSHTINSLIKLSVTFQPAQQLINTQLTE